MDEEQLYYAFLVRVWAVPTNGKLSWRASATDAHTNEKHAFRDVGRLCAFLTALTQGQAPATLATDTEVSQQ